MTMWELYLITKASDFTNALGFLVFLTILSTAISGLFTTCPEETVANLSKKVFKITFPAFLVVGTLFITIPDTKQIAAIIGLHQVVNNEEAQKLPDNILKFMNTWLEEQTND